MRCCVSQSSSVGNDDDDYRREDPVDDVISEPNKEELVLSGGFFKDKETINFSLDKAKDDDKFNMAMIENAYYSINGNYNYIIHPIINKIDIGIITVCKYSRELQEKIDEKYNFMSNNDRSSIVMTKDNYQVKSRKILNELIVEELIGVKISDINNSDWVNENPLAKAMLDCIKDNHDQSDINAIISDRVVQFYNKMKEIPASNEFLIKCIDEIVEYVFLPEGNKVTFADKIAANIKVKIKNSMPEINRQISEAEQLQLDKFMATFI
jgi:hypothetical protein